MAHCFRHEFSTSSADFSLTPSFPIVEALNPAQAKGQYCLNLDYSDFDDIAREGQCKAVVRN